VFLDHRREIRERDWQTYTKGGLAGRSVRSQPASQPGGRRASQPARRTASEAACRYPPRQPRQRIVRRRSRELASPSLQGDERPASRDVGGSQPARWCGDKADPGWRSAFRRNGFPPASIRSPVADAVLGHGEVVGCRLHAVLIRVLHDGELLGMTEHARLRVVHLECDRRRSGGRPRANFRAISCEADSSRVRFHCLATAHQAIAAHVPVVVRPGCEAPLDHQSEHRSAGRRPSVRWSPGHGSRRAENPFAALQVMPRSPLVQPARRLLGGPSTLNTALAARSRNSR